MATSGDGMEADRGASLAGLMGRSQFLLGSTDNPVAVLQRFTDLVVPDYADMALVMAADEAEDRLRILAGTHRDPGMPEILEQRLASVSLRDSGYPSAQVSRTGVPYVALGSGEALPVATLGDDVARALEGTEASALVVMPMVVGERTIGSFVLGMLPPSTRSFSPGDVAVAGYLASRCGSLLETRRIRMALESALRAGARDRAVLDLVLANAPLGIAVLGGDLRFLLVNDALARIHGRPAEDLVGRTPDEVVDAPDADETALLVEQVLETGEPILGVERDVRLPGRGGERRQFSVDYFAVTGPSGERLGVTALVRDVTDERRVEAERRSLESALERTRRLETVSQLAGGVAHDFNNLLAVIGLRCQLVRRRVADEGLSRDLAVVETAIGQARDLAERLLTFSRREPLEPHLVDVDAALVGMAAVLDDTAGPGCEVSLVAGSGERVLMGPDALARIVVNLVANARDAMPDGGRIDVVADPAPSGRVRVTVRDHGVGMSAEVRDRAMEPFFTTKAHGVGTGLGLSTVYGLVTGAGGTIDLESAPGRGTSVEIELPAAAAAAAPSAEEGTEGTDERLGTRPRRSGTVLVVDDEPELVAVVHDVLAERGFDVRTAPSVAAATSEAAAIGELALLVTDVVMPDGSGLELAAELQRRQAGLPIVVMSGHVDDGRARGPRPVGAPVLRKPFTLDELVAAVDRVVPTTPL